MKRIPLALIFLFLFGFNLNLDAKILDQQETQEEERRVGMPPEAEKKSSAVTGNDNPGINPDEQKPGKKKVRDKIAEIKKMQETIQLEGKGDNSANHIDQDIVKDILLEHELEIDSIKTAYERKIIGTQAGQSQTLSFLILGFGLIAALMILGFYSKILNRMSDKVMKLVALIIIASLSVFLIVAGFSNEQITPVVGLLGTLTGYVISKSDGSQNQNPPPPSEV